MDVGADIRNTCLDDYHFNNLAYAVAAERPGTSQAVTPS